jgi:hypothetical protein
VAKLTTVIMPAIKKTTQACEGKGGFFMGLSKELSLI